MKQRLYGAVVVVMVRKRSRPNVVFDPGFCSVYGMLPGSFCRKNLEIIVTDELAGLPQSALREIVLRLICPEQPPPLRATSEVNLREQQATASLRPAGAEQLDCSPEALDFLNRFNAHEPLIDEIVGLFLTVAETPPPSAHLLNPYCTPSLVFEEVLYAYSVAKLGASTKTMERLMVQLVRGGWHRQAEDVAHQLGRSLTRDEVLGLVESYTRGAVYGSTDDEFWPKFAGRHLGPEDEQLVNRWIHDRNVRARNDIY